MVSQQARLLHRHAGEDEGPFATCTLGRPLLQARRFDDPGREKFDGLAAMVVGVTIRSYTVASTSRPARRLEVAPAHQEVESQAVMDFTSTRVTDAFDAESSLVSGKS